MIEIRDRRFLRGPNLHSRHPCLQVTVQVEGWEPLPDERRAAIADRLVRELPSLHEHHGLLDRPGGFVEELKGRASVGEMLGHVLLELQCLTGAHLRLCRVQALPQQRGLHRIACGYRTEAVADRALELAAQLVTAAIEDAPFDIDAALESLRTLQARHGVGPSTAAIIDAAERRGVPVIRLSDHANLFQLGWGCRQRRIQATMTDRTSVIAVDVASDKELTKELLAAAGIPVPRGEVVTTPEEAQRAAVRVGAPVAIKPLAGNQGKGVTTNVTTPEEVARAFERAHAFDRRVIVEQTVQGADHRVLVVGQRMVAAARRAPPQVTGDGRSTVRQLVECENANPLRGRGHESPLTRIPMDDHATAMLQEAGLDWDSVPAPGRVVALRSNCNLSTGGTAEDVTERVHPYTAELCVRAAQQIGLDVAGIDLMCSDISRPLEEQVGAVIEVNAAPGIRMHEHPSRGQSQPAGEAIVRSLFGPQRQGRIPVVAVTGTNGKTTTTLAIATALASRGVRVGHTTTEGVFFGGRRMMEGDCTGYWSARSVLTNPNVEAAVLETARGGILKRGLAFDRCDVAVVLNVTEDHLGQDGVYTVDELMRVKAVVAEAASDVVVLNAQDERCVRIAAMLPPEREVLYFSDDPDHPVIRAHLAAGREALVLEGSMIVVKRRQRSAPIVDVRTLPFTLGGRARHNVQNALAAAAALLALDESPTDIAVGLQAFQNSAQANPLRFNVFNVRGVQVVVDYAHNTAAYRALGESVRQITDGRVVAVVSAPGDRRDEELEEVGRACARAFDELVLYELDEDRGRSRGATLPPLEQGARAEVASDTVASILDVREALAEGLRRCRPGDTLVFGCATDLQDLFAVTGSIAPAYVEDGIAPPQRRPLVEVQGVLNGAPARRREDEPLARR